MQDVTKLSYQESCEAVFEAIEEITKSEKGEYPSPVALAIENKKKHKKT